MGELQSRQAHHLVLAMKEQGIKDQKSFAETFGFSRTSVNDWVNGKATMSEKKAKKIHDRWPQYSVDWLRGYTDAKDESEKFELDYYDKRNRFRNMEKSVLILGHLGGGFDFDYPWRTDGTGWPTSTVRVKRKKESVTLTSEEWGAFVNEVSDYISMRFNSMLERGKW